MTKEKTHYRKAFHSPYLSAADITEPITLTISHVRLNLDETKKTKNKFNTAFFVEREIRKGEALKPMILNVSNSKMVKDLSKSPFIDDWNNIKVNVYVDKNIRFGKEMVEGLRIRKPPKDPPKLTKADFVAKVDVFTNETDLKRWRDDHLSKAKVLGNVDFKWFEKYITQLLDGFSKKEAT